MLLEKDSIQDELIFLKRVILWYGMLCYPMLGMVWGVWYSIGCLCYAMRFICYAMVHVVKDKHSTSVCWHRSKKKISDQRADYQNICMIRLYLTLFLWKKISFRSIRDYICNIWLLVRKIWIKLRCDQIQIVDISVSSFTTYGSLWDIL